MTFPSYRDLIYLTWKQYVLRFDVILLANVAVALPVHLLTTLVTPPQLGAVDQLDLTAWLNSLLVDYNFWLVIVLNLLGNCIMILIDLVIIVMIRSMYLQKMTSWQSLWKQAVQYYPRAVAASIVASLLTMFGFGLLIIPGIVVSMLFSLVLPVVVWENLSIGQALRRSAALVKQYWWKVFFVLVITELWITLTAWLLLSTLPVYWPFTVFGVTVISVMSSFQTILRVIVYTACVLQTQPATSSTPTTEQ